jgi:hypothetical protein
MLSFAQPFFLFALAGLAIPVLIHRISRARPIAWAFPSIERIRRTPLPRQGRRRLSDWLLLLLRLAILAFLILALAGPSWSPPADSSLPGPSDRPRGVVVVDHSSSMAGWGAPAEVRGVIRGMPDSEAVDWGWVVFADTIRSAEAPVADRTLDKLLETLEASPPGLAVGRPEPALSQAINWLLEAESPDRRLHVISDFQTANWETVDISVPDSVTLSMHPVGRSERRRNLSVEAAYPVPAQGGRLRVITQVMNHGSEAEERLLTLETRDGRTTREAVFASRQLTTAAFEIPPPSGSAEATVFLPDSADPYPRDNRLSLEAAPPPPLDVLALNLRPASGDGAEEIFFLGEALDTATEQDWLRYSVVPVGIEPINPATLDRTAAVFIPAASAADPGVPWERLADYVASGGLLVVTLGEDAVRAIRRITKGGFPVGSYRGLAGRARGDRFYPGPLPDESPLARVFTGPAERDLFLMALRQYARLGTAEAGRVFLQSEFGDPLIQEIALGRGRLVLSAFPWDRQVSDFPLRASFLPVMREIFSLSAETEAFNPPERPLRAESGTATMGMDSLRNRLGDTERPAAAGEARPGTGFANDGSPILHLAPWLMLAAFLFWLAESLLASRLAAKS